MQPQPPKTNPQQPTQPVPPSQGTSPQNQAPNKGPSQGSQSTQPSQPATNPGKIDLFNMFGTNVPTQNTQPTNVTPKQNVPVQPPSNLPPKGPTQDNNFADIWATSSTGQPQNKQPGTSTNPVGPVQPQNKATTPTQPNPPPQGRTTTFNQLFGLGGKWCLIVLTIKYWWSACVGLLNQN